MRRGTIAIAVAGALLAVLPAGAHARSLDRQQLRDELASALGDAGGDSGAWVHDVDAGEDLFASSAAERQVPASNQKLFTTAAFVDALGAEGRLETRVFARGGRRGRDARVLAGDLVIVGDGDPALGTSGFARRNDLPLTRIGELAREIAAAGIRKVTGKVRADDTIFDRRRRAGPYLSPLSGLSFNSGFAGGDYARAPELIAARQLRRALLKKGVRVAAGVGRANLGPSQLQREPVAGVASPPASTLIEETNKPSNNFFAEMLLKRLGAEGGDRGSRERGAARVEAFAHSAGTDVQAVDGSGLSRRNRASPEEVGRLLVAMAGGEQAVAFAESLAVAGRDGTLADRMEGTAAEGVCAAKTGTLDGVSALSGYCEAGTQTIAFSILMNSINVDAAHRAQDRMAAAIARYRP